MTRWNANWLPAGMLANAFWFGLSSADPRTEVDQIATIYFNQRVDGQLFADATLVAVPSAAQVEALYLPTHPGGYGADINCNVSASGTLKSCKAAFVDPDTVETRRA